MDALSVSATASPFFFFLDRFDGDPPDFGVVKPSALLSLLLLRLLIFFLLFLGVSGSSMLADPVVVADRAGAISIPSDVAVVLIDGDFGFSGSPSFFFDGGTASRNLRPRLLWEIALVDILNKISLRDFVRPQLRFLSSRPIFLPLSRVGV